MFRPLRRNALDTAIYCLSVRSATGAVIPYGRRPTAASCRGGSIHSQQDCGLKSQRATSARSAYRLYVPPLDRVPAAIRFCSSPCNGTTLPSQATFCTAARLAKTFAPRGCVAAPRIFCFARHRYVPSSLPATLWIRRFIVYPFAPRTGCVFPIRLYSGGNAAFAPVRVTEQPFPHRLSSRTAARFSKTFAPPARSYIQ
jgi:hypothetical protein